MLGRMIGVAVLLSMSAAIGLSFSGSPASAQVSRDMSDRLSAQYVAQEPNRGWIDYLLGSNNKRRASKRQKSAAKDKAAKEDEIAASPTSTVQGGRVDARSRAASIQSDTTSVQRRHAGTKDMTGSISRASTLRDLLSQAVVKGHVRRVGSDEVRLEVGATVPLSIPLRPLPAAIVKLKPAWRGYEFFVSGKEVAIVQPTTSKIVELIRYAE